MGRIVQVDLGGLGLESGGQILLRRSLRQLGPDETLEVSGTHAELTLHLRAWCRVQGYHFEAAPGASDRVGRIRPGAAWHPLPAERAGSAPAAGIVSRPPLTWGLAGRSAEVELGGPEFDFELADKAGVWSDNAPRLYARAAAAQWDPASAVDWSTPVTLDDDLEDAVVQVMTYLIENETAALLVPTRFLGKVHPHFREVMQLLAIQAADEARHIEVFTRRALLRRGSLGLSTVGGQASLKTLFDESDFACASFLLNVMGEGSFLVLLRFLHRFAPDPITRRITHLAAQDEARHVAFGLAHLCHQASEDPGLLGRLAQVMHRRHAELRDTTGLNDRVLEALTILASGDLTPARLAVGHARVMRLRADMHAARRQSLLRLGFPAEEADTLSGLHTRNFM